MSTPALSDSPRRSPGRSPRHAAIRVLAVSLLALGCVGCGSSSDEATSATSSSALSSSTTSSAPATSEPGLPSTTVSTVSTTTTPSPDSSIPAGVPLRTGGPTVVRQMEFIEGEEQPSIKPDGTNPPDEPFSTPGYRLAAAASESSTRLLGSGCTPPSPTIVTDGLWYGYINRLEAGVVSFDLMCFYLGDLDGLPGCEVDMDSCVVNESTKERTAPLATSADFSLPRKYGDYTYVNDSATFDQFATWLGLPNNTLPVWLRVTGGAVTDVEVEQQLAG